MQNLIELNCLGVLFLKLQNYDPASTIQILLLIVLLVSLLIISNILKLIKSIKS